MKIRFTSSRTAGDPSMRLTPSTALMAVHALPAQLMQPPTPAPRPVCVEERLWATLAEHIRDARCGGSIANTSLRDAVNAVVAQLRIGCVVWDEVYAVLDSAVMNGVTERVAHPLERELNASRSAAIVAHMHSWADVRRLAEIEDPCASPD